jgi:peroxiredoxin
MRDETQTDKRGDGPWPSSVGDKLPDATLLQDGRKRPEKVSMAEKLKGRKVVIFGGAGRLHATCTSAHVPSFVRTKGQFDAKGVDEIICVSVNDPFVMRPGGRPRADGGGDHAARRSDARSSPRRSG